MSDVSSSQPANITHKIKMANGQTADGFVVEQYDGTDVFKVDKDGYITKQFDPDAASYIVWKSGSTYYAKSGADGSILSSGAAFHTVVQAAIDAAQTSGGGSVLIRPGDYTQTDNIRIKTHTRVDGGGRGTYIKRADSATFVMFDFEETNWTTTNMHFNQGIGNLVLDGNAAGGGSGTIVKCGDEGTDYDHAPDFGYFENLVIINGDGAGMEVYDCYWNTFENIRVSNCVTYGVYHRLCNMNMWLNCRFASCGTGFWSSGQKNTYTCLDFSGCDVGFYQAANHNTLDRCWFEANTVDIDGNAGTYLMMDDCFNATVINNVRYSSVGPSVAPFIAHNNTDYCARTADDASVVALLGLDTADQVNFCNDSAFILFGKTDLSSTMVSYAKIMARNNVKFAGQTAAFGTVNIAYVNTSDQVIISDTGNATLIGKSDNTTAITLRGPTTLNKYIKLASYATASKPGAAAAGVGALIWCTDATAGQELQCSDGSAWKYITLTALS